jgi:heat shock 70kDa protein 1/2/6/8
MRGIICDKSGQWVSGFGAHIGYSSAIVAELWGVIYGLKLAWYSGCRNIKLEIDIAD